MPAACINTAPQAVGRQLGEIRNYSDLLALLRSRAEELELTRLAIDKLARLQSGYAAKLFSPMPPKRITSEVMEFLLPALGLKLIAVEDPESLEQIKKHGFVRHAERVDRGAAIRVDLTRNFMRKIGRKGGLAKAALRRRRKAQTANATAARWSAAKAMAKLKTRPAG
jgi:hypothetical protein